MYTRYVIAFPIVFKLFLNYIASKFMNWKVPLHDEFYIQKERRWSRVITEPHLSTWNIHQLYIWARELLV